MAPGPPWANRIEICRIGATAESIALKSPRVYTYIYVYIYARLVTVKNPCDRGECACIRGEKEKRKEGKRRGKERRKHLAMLTRTAHARNTVFYNGPATSHVPIHRQSRRLFSLLDFPTILGEGKRMVEVEMMGRRTASSTAWEWAVAKDSNLS